MGILQDIFWRKERRQIEAWLILEGWEPKTIYRTRTNQEHVIVREGVYIRDHYIEPREIKYENAPVVNAMWKAFDIGELWHFAVVAGNMGNKK